MVELLKPRDAAKTLGVSYPTLKQWIYGGKLKSVRTAGGHHRIPQDEITRLLGADKRRAAKRHKPTGLDAISGRNKLYGTVVEIRYEGLLAQVTIDVGGQHIVSIITSDASRALGLRKGAVVYALVKATEVMVIRG